MKWLFSSRNTKPEFLSPRCVSFFLFVERPWLFLFCRKLQRLQFEFVQLSFNSALTPSIFEVKGSRLVARGASWHLGKEAVVVKTENVFDELFVRRDNLPPSLFKVGGQIKISLI